MYRQVERKVTARQFNMVEDERSLNKILNTPGIEILDERVSQDKIGNFVVYLKYIDFDDETPNDRIVRIRQEREVDAL